MEKVGMGRAFRMHEGHKNTVYKMVGCLTSSKCLTWRKLGVGGDITIDFREITSETFLSKANGRIVSFIR
jgi:hypothetical protein